MVYYVGEGRASGNKNIADLLANQTSTTQNQYLPDALRIANALKQNELNFAPRMSQAELAYKMAQTPYLQAQTGEANARIPLINSQVKEALQKLNFPNIGSEGALGTIDYGRWLEKYHPELSAQVKQSVAMQDAQQAQPSQQQTASALSPILSSILSGQPMQQPDQQQQQQQSRMGFPFSQSQPLIQQAGQQQVSPQQSIAQALIKSGLAQSEAKPQQMLVGRSGMGVGQKEIMGLQQQLMNEHPDWDSQTANQAASAYLSGDEILPDGSQLPKPSGIVQSTIAQIQKRNSTAQIQNQAANMQVLSEDLNSIDLTPLKAFAGPAGKIKYLTEAGNMAAGRPVSQEFRDYTSFQRVTSNFAMDALRKGFGTSVVPEYVYSTLGNASNPGNAWWSDPAQVERDWKATTDWINKNAKSYQRKATQGISAKGTENIGDGSSGSKENILMKTPDGRTWSIPKNKMEEAKKRGAVEMTNG